MPSDLVPGGQGLVTPQRVEYVLLHVSDLERALAYYRVLYGKERRAAGEQRQFSRSAMARDCCWTGLVRVRQRPAAHHALRHPCQGVRPCRDARRHRYARWHGRGRDEGKVLRLRDVDGIELDLVPG